MVKGDKHQDLLNKTGGQGFPHFVALDAKGKTLATLGMVPRTTQNFQGMIAEAVATEKELAMLQRKAEQGDPTAKVQLLEKLLDLSHLDLAAARKRFADLGEVPAAKLERVQTKLQRLEFMTIMADVTRDPATHAAAGKLFAAMVKEGRLPDDRGMKLQSWFFILAHAEAARDVSLFKKGAAIFKAEKGIRPAFLKQLDTRLADLEKKAKGS